MKPNDCAYNAQPKTGSGRGATGINPLKRTKNARAVCLRNSRA